MRRGAEGEPFQILLVEDNPGDVDLITDVLREFAVANMVSVADDGQQAMEFLRRQGRHAGAPTPDLILLDLNLPRKDGREVLAELKTDDTLKHIPVVVLTSSEAERDLLQTYRLHANCFVTKPVDLEEFFKVVNTLATFWLQFVKLPPLVRIVPEAAVRR